MIKLTKSELNKIFFIAETRLPIFNYIKYESTFVTERERRNLSKFYRDNGINETEENKVLYGYMERIIFKLEQAKIVKASSNYHDRKHKSILTIGKEYTVVNYRFSKLGMEFCVIDNNGASRYIPFDYFTIVDDFINNVS